MNTNITKGIVRQLLDSRREHYPLNSHFNLLEDKKLIQALVQQKFRLEDRLYNTEQADDDVPRTDEQLLDDSVRVINAVLSSLSIMELNKVEISGEW